MSNAEIRGTWTPADQSETRLEAAQTDQDGLVALRDNYDPERVIFATPKQIRNFADSVQKGNLRNVVR